jgi:hypothetical protein
MREHRLKNIEIENHTELLESFPNFDFYKFVHVAKLEIAWHSDCLSLFLTAIYDGTHKMQFLFEGVKSLILPDLRNEGLWLSELELEDQRSMGIEGVNYQLKDFGSCFCLTCSKIVFLECEEKRCQDASA